MKTVKKKILPEYFEDVADGIKQFELRKDEDNIQVGDFLKLEEWDGEKYTGRKLVYQVRYVLRDAEECGLKDGYCVIGL